MECARLATAEEHKVFLSQDLEKQFSEALQDSESFNKIQLTAMVQQAMTEFVMGVTGTEMEFTEKNDVIDSAIQTLYNDIENYLALKEKEECCLDPVFEIDVEFQHDEVLEEEAQSEPETRTPEPEIEVSYIDSGEEPLLEIDVFAEPESEPEYTTRMPEGEPETHHHIDPMEYPDSEPEKCETAECKSGYEDYVNHNDKQFELNDKEKIFFEDDETIHPVDQPEDENRDEEDEEGYNFVDLINDIVQIADNLATDSDLEEEFEIDEETKESENSPEVEAEVETPAEGNHFQMSSTATTSTTSSTTTTSTTPAPSTTNPTTSTTTTITTTTTMDAATTTKGSNSFWQQFYG